MQGLKQVSQLNYRITCIYSVTDDDNLKSKEFYSKLKTEMISA